MHKNLKLLLKITTRKKLLALEVKISPIRLQKLPLINNFIMLFCSYTFFVQILIF